MKTKTLYIVPAEYTFGVDNDLRKAQLVTLGELGVKEMSDSDQRVICTAETALDLLRRGYSGTYFNPKSLDVVEVPDTSPGMPEMFSVILDKVLALQSQLEAKSCTPGEAPYNSRCGCEQPSTALHNVREVMVLEDSCTDALQQKLSEGWRIISAQPQPDRRRSDFVLGRNDVNSTRTQAHRG